MQQNLSNSGLAHKKVDTELHMTYINGQQSAYRDAQHIAEHTSPSLPCLQHTSYICPILTMVCWQVCGPSNSNLNLIADANTARCHIGLHESQLWPAACSLHQAHTLEASWQPSCLPGHADTARQPTTNDLLNKRLGAGLTMAAVPSSPATRAADWPGSQLAQWAATRRPSAGSVLMAVIDVLHAKKCGCAYLPPATETAGML